MGPILFAAISLVINQNIAAASVGYWRFEEGTAGSSITSASDSSGYNATLTPAGAGMSYAANPATDAFQNPVRRTAADNSFAAQFSGGDYLKNTTFSGIANVNNLTIELSFRDTANTRAELFNSGGTYPIEIQLSGTSLDFNQPGCFSVVNVPGTELTWKDPRTTPATVHMYTCPHNVTAVFTQTSGVNGLWTLYFDGKPVTTQSGQNISAGGIYVGAKADGTLPFGGMIDEVRLSNTALTPDQFLDTNPGSRPPLAYYSFETESGTATVDGAALTSAFDISGHGYHLSPIGVLEQHYETTLTDFPTIVPQSQKPNTCGLLIGASGVRMTGFAGFDGKKDFAIEGYARRTGNDGGLDRVLVDLRAGAGGPYGLTIKLAGGTNEIKVLSSGYSTMSTVGSGITLNKTFHFAVIRSSGKFSIYVDGKLKGGPTAMGYGTSLLNGTLAVGSFPDGSSSFVGIVDEIALYDEAIAQKETMPVFGGKNIFLDEAVKASYAPYPEIVPMSLPGLGGATIVSTGTVIGPRSTAWLPTAFQLLKLGDSPGTAPINGSAGVSDGGSPPFNTGTATLSSMITYHGGTNSGFSMLVADFENASGTSAMYTAAKVKDDMAAMRIQIQADSHPRIFNSRIGNYNYVTFSTDATGGYPWQRDYSNRTDDYTTSGMDISMPSCYPYGSYSSHTSGSASTGYSMLSERCPNTRAALFWAPLEKYSGAKRFLSRGHLILPWVNEFVYQAGYAPQPPPNEMTDDLKAFIKHLRLRGADGYILLTSNYITGYSNAPLRADEISAWHELDPFFSGTGTFVRSGTGSQVNSGTVTLYNSGTGAILNLETNKSGVQWSGYRVSGTSHILVSNLTGCNTGTNGGTTSLQSDPLASKGLLVQFSATGTGQYVELKLPGNLLPTGTYAVQVRDKTLPDGGTYQLSIDGIDYGSSVDQYGNPGATARDVNFSGTSVAFGGIKYVNCAYSSIRNIKYYNYDYHSGTASGNSFEFTFDGTGVDYIAESGTTGGDVTISIDGVVQAPVVHLYSATTGPLTAYNYSATTGGWHTIKGVSGTVGNLMLDSFKVYKGGTTSMVNNSPEYKDKVLRFTVTGKNVASSGYTLSIDRIVFTATGTSFVRTIEAEDLGINTISLPHDKYPELPASLTISGSAHQMFEFH